MPGEVVTIDPQTLQATRATFATELPAVEPTSENVLGLLREGVKDRLIGERPIAVMLSGGLDSTLVLSLARQHYAGRIVAYTAAYAGSHDLVEAGHVADYFGIDLVRVPMPAVTEAAIEEAVRVVEIPFKAQVECALAQLPLVQAMQSDGFAICLTGEGADELFLSYGNALRKIARAADFDEVRAIKAHGVGKMARANLPRLNKVGMRYGVECRSPFMQRQLVDLAVNATLEQSPPHKRILRAAAEGSVPERTFTRPKTIFQQGAGTTEGAASVIAGNPVIHYNRVARETFGHLPRS
jgi:asparagine synthase (glutamine-hydrolysing)